MTQITDEEIRALSKLLLDHSGISLDQDKGYLLETRLRPLLSAHGFASLLELHTRASLDHTGTLQKQIVEAMTTNETFFFRDQTPFDLLRHKIIPDLIDRRTAGGYGGAAKIPIRIWSAACSTGQEVYSIAMTLIEMLGDCARYEIFILGTDISDKVVAQASYGKYSQFEMDRGLPPHYRNRYFSPLDGGWRIKDEVRGLAQFRTVNLMKPLPDLGGTFDLIFCRNVAIYFNQTDKARLFQKLARVLQPDGALIVGGSESLVGIAPDFQTKNYLKGIFYQLAVPATASTPQPPAAVPTGLPGGVLATPAMPPPMSARQAPVVRPAPSPPRAGQLPMAAPGSQVPKPAEPVSQPSAPLAATTEQGPQPAPLPGIKRSLLAALGASQGAAKPLLHGDTSSPQGSLLSRLPRQQKKTHE